MTSLQRLGKSSSLMAPLLVAGLTVFMMLVILAAPGPTAANGQATLTFVAPEGIIPVETEISVTVHISDVADLWALALTIDFPNELLQVVDDDPQTPGVQVLPGDCPNSVMPNGLVMQNQVDNVDGTINYLVTQLNPTLPITGDCAVFHAHFVTIDGPSANLHFNYVFLSDIDGNQIQITAIDRALTLEEAETELYLPLIIKN